MKKRSTNILIIITTLFVAISFVYTKANSTYDTVFKEISMETALSRLDSGKGRDIYYFGYEECPYCQQAKPILSSVAKETGQTIYYVKTRDSKKNLLYTDKQRKKLTKYISKYMSRNKDEDNKLWLYVPLVVRVKDGVVVKGYEGIGNDEPELNKKQAKKLYRKYLEIMS